MARDEIESRTSDLLGMLGIEDIAERAPHQLSGGQLKRVALASVLVTSPEVLLLDEPTAALDPRTREWFTDVLGRLVDAGTTVVLATHDLHHLSRLADRCVVLGEDHRVLGGGPTGEVLGDHRLLVAANLTDP